jgi:hypothetical protein
MANASNLLPECLFNPVHLTPSLLDEVERPAVDPFRTHEPSPEG